MTFRSIFYLRLGPSKSEAHDNHALAAAPFCHPLAYSTMAHHLVRRRIVFYYTIMDKVLETMRNPSDRFLSTSPHGVEGSTG